MDFLNELNFFEKNNKHSIVNINYIAVIVIGIIFSFVLMFTYTTIRINYLKTQLYDSTVIEENLSVYGEDKEVNDDETSIALKRDTVSAIDNINEYIKVDSQSLNKIKDSMPSNLFINDMDIQDGKIYIVGYAKSPNIIANFQMNLESNSYFSDVFVKDITNDLGNYIFTLSAQLGK